MKTLFNTLVKSSSAAILLVASVFSINASAATFGSGNPAAASDIKKVVVTGNTNVIIVQNANESVNVDDLDLENVSLKQVGNTLSIGSTTSKPVTVVVYVKDIYRIDASDRATVSTAGKFDVQNLQVMLKDHASAEVKAHTESLYTVISDSAKLELKGSSDNHIYKMNGYAKMDTSKFAAAKTENVATTAIMVATTPKSNDLSK